MPANPYEPSNDTKAPQLIRIFDPSERRSEGAHFWDSLRGEVVAWKDLEYDWIASSCFGDQVIQTDNSPIHKGHAIYIHGPDIAGPTSDNPDWLDNILYLGSSTFDWLARIARFGDEYAIAPGLIDERVIDSAMYRQIYRDLNPGLPW
jgi:hypothetical protein